MDNSGIPQEIKDAVDALVIAFTDLKAGKGANLIQDEMPSIMKLAGEFAALKADLTVKGAVQSLEYLAEKIAGVL